MDLYTNAFLQDEVTTKVHALGSGTVTVKINGALTLFFDGNEFGIRNAEKVIEALQEAVELIRQGRE